MACKWEDLTEEERAQALEKYTPRKDTIYRDQFYPIACKRNKFKVISGKDLLTQFYKKERNK